MSTRVYTTMYIVYTSAMNMCSALHLLMYTQSPTRLHEHKGVHYHVHCVQSCFEHVHSALTFLMYLRVIHVFMSTIVYTTMAIMYTPAMNGSVLFMQIYLHFPTYATLDLDYV